ncbi:hypothetical protein DPMN_049346, partial [Dreissena polymorpha]
MSESLILLLKVAKVLEFESSICTLSVAVPSWFDTDGQLLIEETVITKWDGRRDEWKKMRTPSVSNWFHLQPTI